jgi:hypothetical protein
MKSTTLIRLCFSLVLVGFILYLSGAKSFFSGTLDSPFFSVALLSLFLILVRTGVTLREFLWTALLFSALAALEFRLIGYPSIWPVWLSLVGMASFATLSLRLIWSPSPQRRLAAFVLIPSVLFVVSEWCASYLLYWTELLHPKALDLYLYSFDASMGLQLPFLMGRFFAHLPTFAWACNIVYIGLPVAIGLVYAGCCMRDTRTALAACIAFLLTGPIGILLYNLFPALGPIHLFRSDFPWHPLTFEQTHHLFLESVRIPGARNAIPSLHAAWIFLVFWHARGLSRVEKVAAALCVVLTLCATIGTGEHYFVDLVVAVPFALLILALTNLLVGHHRLQQFLPLGIGLATTLAWLFGLRYAPHLFWYTPVIPWLACAATLVICFLALKAISVPVKSAATGGSSLTNSTSSADNLRQSALTESVASASLQD